MSRGRGGEEGGREGEEDKDSDNT